MDDRDRTGRDPGLLTLTQAAARCGYTRAALRQRARRGSLPSVKGNDGLIRLRASDVDALPPPDADVDMDADDQDQLEGVGEAMDLLRSIVADLRDDRDHMRTGLDAARDELSAERIRTAQAEAQAAAAAARMAAAEALLAAAEAALAEARVPLVLRVIAALRRR